jgi:hypothetical protein
MNVISTYFDEELWYKYGINWISSIRDSTSKVVVITKDLPKQKKISSLGFHQVELEGDKYSTFLKFLDRDSVGIFTLPNVSCSVFSGNPIKSNLRKEELIFVVKNLYKRAEALKILDKLYSLNSAEFIVGSIDFWDGFVEYQKSIGSDFLEESHRYYEDFLYNYFIAGRMLC